LYTYKIHNILKVITSDNLLGFPLSFGIKCVYVQ